jgi:hypothetical protein
MLLLAADRQPAIRQEAAVAVVVALTAVVEAVAVGAVLTVVVGVAAGVVRTAKGHNIFTVSVMLASCYPTLVWSLRSSSHTLGTQPQVLRLRLAQKARQTPLRMTAYF